MLFFFFNDTATTDIYTLSLHDALPIWVPAVRPHRLGWAPRDERETHRGSDDPPGGRRSPETRGGDRKSTRLNSSHPSISYAVFCLKKKKKRETDVSGQILFCVNRNPPN